MSDEETPGTERPRSRYAGHPWWWWALAALCAIGIIGSLVFLYI
ncbi:MAG TPA: hypothetical protein VNQ48_06150 [Microbacteriaceae bacterium]|nr:hypothetical protein [Microbacteriaceae bacterium]